MPLAEAMSAALAFVVVEYVVVNILTDSSTSGTTRCAAYEHPHEEPSKAAHRTCDQTDGCPDFCAAEGGSSATGGTCDSSNGRTSFAAIVKSEDVLCMAAGAGRRVFHINLIKIQSRWILPRHTKW
ncbi:hypothetical protein [Bordetella bronchiseptica]|uniref:hypothetical protein n=1 Tax=Bordetella bronchiseptica TaxID=518 RepID=UPI0013144412|nr:hypothetical protein [Bordetella bronchiseptica]